MDVNLWTVIGVVGVGVFLILTMLLLPQRKLLDEKEKKPLYEERCAANWRSRGGGLVAGGNIPVARISFYDDFFVIALINLTKVNYSDVLSAAFKSGGLSNSVTIHLAKGSSLVIHPKNLEKLRSLMSEKGMRLS